MNQGFNKELIEALSINQLKPKMKVLASVEELQPPFILSAKADGEFTLVRWNRIGQTFTVNRYGHWRMDFPALNQLDQAMKRTNLDSADFLAELYGVNREGDPVGLPEFIHYVKGGEEKLLNQVHIGVFDLVRTNGKLVNQDYSWKLAEVEDWLTEKDGYGLDKVYVLPTTPTLESREEAKTVWNIWVIDGKYEGLVARSNGDIYKIKPILDVDAVIVALNKVDSTGHETKRWKENRVSTVRIALMDENGTYVVLGDVTIPQPEVQKALWQLQDFRVSEDSERVYVKPIVVVQVKYTSIFRDSLCEELAYHGTYVRTGERGFAKMRHPRFVRFRKDKQVNPVDLRLEQVIEDVV